MSSILRTLFGLGIAWVQIGFVMANLKPSEATGWYILAAIGSFVIGVGSHGWDDS